MIIHLPPVGWYVALPGDDNVGDHIR